MGIDITIDTLFVIKYDRLLCIERTAEYFISAIRLHAEDGVDFCRLGCLTDATDICQQRIIRQFVMKAYRDGNFNFIFQKNLTPAKST